MWAARVLAAAYAGDSAVARDRQAAAAAESAAVAQTRGGAGSCSAEALPAASKEPSSSIAANSLMSSGILAAVTTMAVCRVPVPLSPQVSLLLTDRERQSNGSFFDFSTFELLMSTSHETQTVQISSTILNFRIAAKLRIRS